MTSTRGSRTALRAACACLVLSLALLAPVFAQMNFVANSGFESGAVSPWYQSYYGTEFTTYAVVAGAGHSGQYGCVGTGGPGMNGSQAPVQLVQTGMAFQPNTTYALSVWHKAAGPGWGAGNVCEFILVEFDSSGGRHESRLDLFTAPVDWTNTVYTFKTRPDTVSGGLSFNTYQLGTADKIYFDDICQMEPSVNNTGFENSTWAPWTADGGGGMTWTMSASNPHWGDKCALATGGSSAAYEGKLLWADKPAYPDSDYRFSLWVRNTGTDWGAYGGSNSQSWFKAVALEADAGGDFGALGVHDLTPVQSSIPNWTRLVTEFTTSPTTTQVRIIIKGHLAAASDSVALDDIALLPGRATKVSWIPFDISSMKNAIAAGADVVGIPIQDISSAYYPSAYDPPNATYGDGNVVSQAISYAHDMGVALEAAIPPCMDAPALTAHPEWRRRYTDSTQWLTIPADTATGCLVGPYGDYLIDEIKEIAEKVGVDGMTFDGYNYLTCYCDYCKAKFLADTGHSIPTTQDFDDPVFRQYIFWQDAQIMDHMVRMKAAARAIYPKFDFYIWSTNAGRYGHFASSPRYMPTELNQLFDCSMQEWWADESNIGLSVVPDFGARYLGAVSRGTQWLAEPYMMTHTRDMNYGPWASSLPEEEVQFRMFTELAAGGIACYAGATDKTYMIKSVFDAAEARRPWTYQAQPMKWGAMVISEPTRQFYGRFDPVGLYMNNCFGYYAALMEQHIPIDLLTHTDLRNGIASGYKVLILPNMACMSSDDIAAVRSFVAAGGGLVATGATSLYDEEGVAKSDYALGDLFKARKTGSKMSIQGRVAIGEVLFGRNSAELGKLLSPTGRVTSFVGELFPVTMLTGGATRATVAPMPAGTTTYPLYINNTNTGGGRVAFLPGCLDSGYFRSPYPYEAVLLKDAVAWAASTAPPVSVVGPKDLQVTCFTQKDGKRLVIHLLNGRNTNAGRAYAPDDVPVRDEVVPIRNIEVWFDGIAPTSVTLQPENTPLAPTQSDGRTKVVVPELRQHSMVVADVP